MKYEMIFGDPQLFNHAPDDAAFVSVQLGEFRYFTEENLHACKKFNIYKFQTCDTQLAMRRIIKEPKCWAVEDQKAGLLPEVGCLVFGLNGRGECEVVASEKNELALRHVSTRNLMLVTVSAFNRNFKPIETPEEKAVRLRSEWCHAALRLINDELSDACDAAVIYDALLSGSLSAPTKGGE